MQNDLRTFVLQYSTSKRLDKNIKPCPSCFFPYRPSQHPLRQCDKCFFTHCTKCDAPYKDGHPCFRDVRVVNMDKYEQTVNLYGSVVNLLRIIHIIGDLARESNENYSTVKELSHTFIGILKARNDKFREELTKAEQIKDSITILNGIYGGLKGLLIQSLSKVHYTPGTAEKLITGKNSYRDICYCKTVTNEDNKESRLQSLAEACICSHVVL